MRMVMMVKVKGQGSIMPMDKGDRCKKWKLRVWTDCGLKSRVVNGSKREALVALEQFKEELRETAISTDAFGPYAQNWLKHQLDRGLAPRTINNKRRDLRNLARVVPDNTPLTNMNVEFCREALHQLRHGGAAKGGELSGSYMESIFCTFKAIMKQAVDDEKINRNPLDAIPIPKSDTGEKKCLTPEQIEAVLDRLDEMPLDGRVMAIYTILLQGLRRGEACALKDSDVVVVDDSHGYITVTTAVKDNKGLIGGTKTEAGTRTLPMPQRMIDKAIQWRVERLSQGLEDSEWFCCNTFGGHLGPPNLYRWWKTVNEQLGALNYSLHELRHSNLSWVARSMSPYDLKTWAGWSSIAPAKIYIHDDYSALENALKRAESFSTRV